MSVKKFEYGEIEYRMPDIVEGIELSANVGFDVDKKSGQMVMPDNLLLVLARYIKHMKPFITKIDVKIKEKKVSTFDQALKHYELMKPLSDIAGEIMGKLDIKDEKKR